MLNSTIIIRYLEDELGYRFNELEISSDESLGIPGISFINLDIDPSLLICSI